MASADEAERPVSPSAFSAEQNHTAGAHGSVENLSLVTYSLAPLRPDIRVTVGLCVDVKNSQEVFARVVQRPPEGPSPTEDPSRPTSPQISSYTNTGLSEGGSRGALSPAPTGDSKGRSTGSSDRLPAPFSCWLCMNPGSLVAVDQIFLGVLRAAEHFEQGTMKTNDVKKEILYCASPTRNIAQALQHLGMQPNMREVVLVMVQMGEETQREVCSHIRGSWRDVSELGTFCDTKRIRSFIHCSPEEELLPGGLEAAVMGRIACKYV
ncbi:putative kinase binding protein [Besnoitia besnoiti]|uniref:Putative kinase binding protein n=1 Tax=Besnoitia besnoiti TaxID=94643 RepID=A0A2A9M0W3_BESBE|nr:putative kinase binding protein [Besnoitia besnoiti]PFH31599.1 putative kinase binding protein [Besnoitia besnoiti]